MGHLLQYSIINQKQHYNVSGAYFVVNVFSSFACNEGFG